MVLVIEPEDMSHDEIVEAYVQAPDSTLLRRALREEYNYTSEQMKSMRTGDFRPDQGDDWSEVKGDLSWK